MATAPRPSQQAPIHMLPHQANEATALPPIGHLRSASEYNVQGKEDAIIRDVFNRVILDKFFISYPEAEHERIRMSISTSFQRPSIASLGTLNRLPHELLSDIVLSLDMQSVFTCRQVNTRLRQTIDSFSEYQVITTHALDALCALLRTRLLAPKVSLVDFHRELCPSTCFSCGEFGEVIFLPTFRRYCSLCITTAPEVQMGSLKAIKSHLRLGPEAVRQLLVFKTIKQPDLVTRVSRLTSQSLVSIQQAVQVSAIPQASRNRTERDLSHATDKFSLRACCIFPYYNRHAGKAEYGLSCFGCKRKHLVGREGAFRMLDYGL